MKTDLHSPDESHATGSRVSGAAHGSLPECPLAASTLKGLTIKIFYSDRQIFPGPSRMVLEVGDEVGGVRWWDYMEPESTTTPTMWLNWLRAANTEALPTPAENSTTH